ncbi:glycogen synthase [Candidatus Uhrbacteria bacterium]|nr:glycogen synthase [Candidatus Uhrbacteria bacterium]
MKILFVAAEVAPYVSVGGLSQVMYFLPRALIHRGHDVRIFTPKYGTMDANVQNIPDFRLEREVENLIVPIRHLDLGLADIGIGEENGELHDENTLEYGGAAEVETTDNQNGDIHCSVSFHRPNAADAPTYFLQNEEYYGNRSNVFGYKDDHVRFALFSKACLLWLMQQKERTRRHEKDVWMPDVIQCNDWHTSYLIDLAKHGKRARAALKKVPFVLTVHNFAYQGNADFRYVPDEDRDDGKSPLAPLTSTLLKKQNALKRGILAADAVSTVSATHAKEVLTPEYGQGLEEALKKARNKLTGILNGLDTTEFNPATDGLVPKNFSRRTFVAGRRTNKRVLEREFGLAEDPHKALLAYSGRLSSQKGVELIIGAMDQLLATRDDIQFVCLGSGDDRIRQSLEDLKLRFPDKVGLRLVTDFQLPRKIFAGADLLLIPSMFEPGGIIALEGLRYGAVPLVRRTGGLNDSVQDFNPETREGNGFSFEKTESWALYGAIIEALSIYRQKPLWKRVVSNAMASDFSWEHAAVEYQRWYQRVRRGIKNK